MARLPFDSSAHFPGLNLIVHTKKLGILRVVGSSTLVLMLGALPVYSGDNFEPTQALLPSGEIGVRTPMLVSSGAEFEDIRVCRNTGNCQSRDAQVANTGVNLGSLPENDYATMTLRELNQIRPKFPNPYLSFLPSEAVPDYAYWREIMRRKGRERALHKSSAARFSSKSRIVYTEREPPHTPGSNDSTAVAESIKRFASAAGEVSAVRIKGSFASPSAAVSVNAASHEDDGDLDKATIVDSAAAQIRTAAGTIGDGPFASSTGDYDCYVLRGEAGRRWRIDLAQAAELYAAVDVYDGAGNRLTAYGPFSGKTERFVFMTPSNDRYTFCVRSGSAYPLTNPYDSSSGGGVESTGAYSLSFARLDTDRFKFSLSAGDVLGATATGLPFGTVMFIELFDPNGKQLVGSGQDVSFIYPSVSPLPGAGDVTLAYVVSAPGEYDIQLTGLDGSYDLDAEVFRPSLESAPGLNALSIAATQGLFIDFDGAIVDTTSLFNAPPGFETAELSPFSSFLQNWGLAPADEDAVIDLILAVVEENLSRDMRVNGSNGDRDATTNGGEFDIEISNSRDDPDLSGRANVSRIIVGGTIEESGLRTIGVAQSIDPGNFATQETALVLLDLLSAPATNPNSLNGIPLDPSALKIELVGRAVGTIVAHEAGHLFANFHTDQFNDAANIMDQGGNFSNSFGLGPDGIFGSTDDVDVDFGEDNYVTNEGFVGTQDTLNAVAFGLGTGPNNPPEISAIADVTIRVNATTGPIPFTISDDDDFDVPGSLSLSATSSNTTLVSLAGIAFDQATAFIDDTQRTVTVTPVEGQSGTTTVSVLVSDGQVQSSESFLLTVNANQAPIADAGEDKTAEPMETVRLDGSGSNDPDGSITTYIWTQTAGQAVALAGANTFSPSFSAPESPQTLSFQLLVTDDGRLSATDSVNVIVSSSTEPAISGDAKVSGADASVGGGGGGGGSQDLIFSLLLLPLVLAVNCGTHPRRQ